MQVITLHSLAHTSSKPFTTIHPITSSVVPNSHPSPPILNPNPDENDFLETSPMSDELGLQYILPHPSLGPNECQRIFELRLRKLVRMFIAAISHVQSPSHRLQLDLAASKGFRVPHGLIPSGLALAVWNTPWTGPESMADIDRNSMSVCLLYDR